MGVPKKNDGGTPNLFKSNFGTLSFITIHLQKKKPFWKNNAEQLLSQQESTGCVRMHMHVCTLVHTHAAYARRHVRIMRTFLLYAHAYTTNFLFLFL